MIDAILGRHERELVARWEVSPVLGVAVDDSGCIVLDVPAGCDRVDVANRQALKDALDSAHRYADAVYPPAAPGRPDLLADRSLAFTALLECPGFGQTEGRQAERLVTDFLIDWQGQSDYTNMIAFAKFWWEAR